MEIKKRQFFLLIIAVFSYFLGIAQINKREDCIQTVLRENNINHYFIFKRIDKEFGEVKYKVKYIGVINKKIKLINFTIISGISKHASSNVYVYNINNIILGMYKGFSIKELPIGIDGNNLLFKCNGLNNKNNIIKYPIINNVLNTISIVCNSKEQLFNFYSKGN